ncbi:hypothetical protein K435DRAFT_911965 [Dendrothele bispora CBS 962.96]|uniref:Uncharacterized protein n=1 Tax=Dendrothele bispora (strain CBS 962.96) TaxID=1314807 RepID=A0A4S8LMI7_DENBC|nr:hypothetical protein K435DRAFT_911965 [Dendrothele bispora CBS 962.96]
MLAVGQSLSKLGSPNEHRKRPDLTRKMIWILMIHQLFLAASPTFLSEIFQHIGMYRANIEGSANNKYAPFYSRMEWEVARWAKMRGTGSTAFDDLLAIKGVGDALGLSYRNSADLNKIIDNEIPARRPAFLREEVVIGGQAFDLYKRDILECIRALYGNAEHCKYMCFTPERHYADADKTIRLYHDLHTGRWWWGTQKAVEKDSPGATIIPVIISSDKTQITLFRNKSAYPVYLTIGNLPKEIRRKPSQQGQVLLAYLPTSKLEHITNKSARRRVTANLFHACMSNLLAPLKEAGLEGIIMQSGDGIKRRCHPILAAYVGDYPEQMLVTTGYYGDCPCCEATKDELGNYPCEHNARDMDAAIAVTKQIGTVAWAQACLDANIKPVQHPFWENLPYCDIFRSITPDLLHQLFQGVMKHLIEWLTAICGADEIDARVRRLPPNHGIRIFHKGISTLSRVSGTEHKQMCTFLIGVITDIPSLSAYQSRTLLAATRALLDFLYLSCYPIHTDESLQSLDDALAAFHSNKHIFIELGSREHFNLPKLHFLCHYSHAIKLYGTTDNYNTETTERLHIDFAKDAYRASNHKDEYSQMTRWLERREKVMYHATYIDWCFYSQTNTTSTPAIPVTGSRYDFPGAQRSLTDMKCLLHQKMTTYPTIKSVSFSKLEDVSNRGYGAVQFTSALSRFIVQFRQPDFTPLQVEEYARVVVFPFKAVPVWHHVKFVNEDLFGKETLDVASAYPRRFSVDGQVIQGSRFDTVLVKVRENSHEDENFTNYTRIARIRTIFSIPTHKRLNTLFPPNMIPPKHLAYVEWFTKFARQPEPYSELYRVKLQKKSDGLPAVSVVPLDRIICSVHLYPKWGGAVPSGWTSETVLDDCTSFLVSIFKDSRTYINLA